MLQDTTKAAVAESYNAQKWYIYLLKADGTPGTLHYEMDLDGEEDRLISEVTSLIGGASLSESTGLVEGR